MFYNTFFRKRCKKNEKKRIKEYNFRGEKNYILVKICLINYIIIGGAKMVASIILLYIRLLCGMFSVKNEKIKKTRFLFV